MSGALTCVPDTARRRYKVVVPAAAGSGIAVRRVTWIRGKR